MQKLLDDGVLNLQNPSAFRTDQVVVVQAVIKLIERFSLIEACMFKQTGLFQLRERSVDGGQTDLDIPRQ